jgi:hypothetical protein
MEDAINIPYCAPAPSDTIAMVVVVVLFLLGAWLIRRCKKKRGSNIRKS